MLAEVIRLEGKGQPQRNRIFSRVGVMAWKQHLEAQGALAPLRKNGMRNK